MSTLVSMNPLTLVTKAIKAVPAVRYALGVAGIAAVVAIILGLKLNPEVAVFGTLIVIGLMFVLLVFVRAASKENNNALRLPAQILVWFYTIITIVVTVLFISSYFGHWPISFEKAPDEKPAPRVKSDPTVPSVSAETEMLAKLSAILKKYTADHSHDSSKVLTQKDPAPNPQSASANFSGEQPANSVYEDLRREAQWTHSLNLDCQNTALYRSQQFAGPYKHGPLMGQPMPLTLDDSLVQSLQDDELEIIRRYDSEKPLIIKARDHAIAKIKRTTAENLRFTPNDEMRDSQRFREASYEAEKVTPILNLKNSNNPTCTRFFKMDEYLNSLVNKLGNY